MESNNNKNNNPNVSRSNANSNETGLNLSEFDGIVLGIFKDGTLSQTIGSNKLPEKFQQIIKKKLEHYGCSKGKLGECKLLYGIDNINVDDKVTASVDGVNGFLKRLLLLDWVKEEISRAPVVIKSYAKLWKLLGTR